MTRLLLSVALLASLASGPSGARADAPKTPAIPPGTIKGTVIFEGEPPERPTLKRDADPYCAKTPRLGEDVIVNHGKLRDVLVRVKNGSMGTHAAPATPVVLDQRECMYTPRVVGVMAGQKLAVRNSDGTFHNVHATIRDKLLWNKPQAPKDPELSLDSSTHADDVIDVHCDVHAWMHAYAVVQDHPFFAVTGDDGTFEIKGLEVGTYELETWHPTLGTRTLTVKIGKLARGQVSARFSYKASDM